MKGKKTQFELLVSGEHEDSKKMKKKDVLLLNTSISLRQGAIKLD
jgi:hypothetical protein